MRHRRGLSVAIGMAITALGFAIGIGGHGLADRIPGPRLSGFVTFIADLGGAVIFPGALLGAAALDPHGVRFAVFTAAGDILLYSFLAYKVLGHWAVKNGRQQS